jgi:hypothetical protein
LNTIVRLIVAALAIELRKAIVGAFSAKPPAAKQMTAQPWPHSTVDHVEAQIEAGARAFPAQGCPGCENEAHAHGDRERAWRRHTW